MTAATGAAPSAAVLAAVSAALTALFAGLFVASLPPLDQGWLGYVVLVPLLALARLRGRAARSRAWRWGFVAGLGAFGPVLAWLLPFGVVPWGLLTVVQAAWIGLFVAVVAGWGERPGRAAVAAVTWVGIEAVRAAWPLGGFEWGVLGYTQHDGGPLLGAARVLGVLGVTAGLVVINVAVEEALARVGLHRGERLAAVAARLRAPGAAVLATLAAGLLVAGAPPAASGDAVDVAAVQASGIRSTTAAGVTRQSAERAEAVIERMLAATAQLQDSDPPDLVIWPENSLDSDPARPANGALREGLRRALVMVGGAPIMAGSAEDGPRSGTLYNQMTVYEHAPDDERGYATTGTYRKRKPVPFGEYIPARALFDWYPQLDVITADVLPGVDPTVLHVAGARVGAVICFESTVGTLALDQVRAGANLLVVSTNNAAFGESAMSEQHVTFSQLRAVETGRWVVHAGLSGVSALVAPDGRIVERTGLHEQAVLRADVPLVTATTPALVLAEPLRWLARAGLLAVLVLLWWRRSAARTAAHTNTSSARGPGPAEAKVRRPQHSLLG